MSKGKPEKSLKILFSILLGIGLVSLVAGIICLASGAGGYGAIPLGFGVCISFFAFPALISNNVGNKTHSLKDFKFEDKSHKRYLTCSYCRTKNKLKNTECENCGAPLFNK